MENFLNEYSLLLSSVGIFFIVLHILSGLLNFVVWKIKNYQKNPDKEKDSLRKTLWMLMKAMMSGSFDPMLDSLIFIKKQIVIKSDKDNETI